MFDTSGLNALADDPESRLIVKSMNLGFHVRLSETSVCEVVGTSKPQRRLQLLNLCTSLVRTGEAIVPYHEILKLMAREHAANARFDWLRVDVRWPELEDELARRTFLEDEELASGVKADNKALNKRFIEMWREALTRFEPQLKAEGEPISVATVFETVKDEGSPLWQLAADIYKTATGRELSRSEAKAFVDVCPPAKAMLFAGCVGQYHWGIGDAKEDNRYKAGGLDLFSATYLPLCDRFITNDTGQYNAFVLTAQKAGLKTDVCMYAEFRRLLLIAA
jgi:hypothetical protein